MSELPKHIVVEGPIGAGKTSLAKRLAHSYGSELLLEAASENPFLEKFYQNPKQHALATQMFFLMQRAGQVQALRQSDLFEPVRVADFLIEKDRLFAELILDADELALYGQMYRHLTLDMPPPDLVIYLQAPVGVLQQRIARRGIAMEQGMSSQYLQSLCDAYTRFFHNYQSSPLLVVNAESLNFVDVEQDYQWLLDQIPQVTSGRHYFNPEPIR